MPEYTILTDGSGFRDKPVGQATSRIWRLINLIMMLFFLLAASANMNDADWFIWTPIYVLPAIVSLVSCFHLSISEHNVWGVGLVVLFAVNLAYTMYHIVLFIEAWSSQIQNPLVIEEGRELGGLVIILIWLGITRFSSLGRSSKETSHQGIAAALMIMTVTFGVLPILLWGLCFIGDWHTKIGHCSGMFS